MDVNELTDAIDQLRAERDQLTARVQELERRIQMALDYLEHYPNVTLAPTGSPGEPHGSAK